MNDTEVLLQALHAKFGGTPALLAAFPGGFHDEAAPSGLSTMYLVCEIVGSPIDHAYGTASSLNPTLVFKAVGRGREDVANALKALTDVLDDAATALTSVYSLHRNGGAVPTLIGPDEASESTDLWQWAVAYEFATQ